MAALISCTTSSLGVDPRTKKSIAVGHATASMPNGHHRAVSFTRDMPGVEGWPGTRAGSKRKAGAPEWAGLVLSLVIALLIRWVRQQGLIDQAIVRWLHRHEEPSAS
ncbi:hypothetical protein AB0B88_03120 [Micromonospora haikouensis]|uniref:hypothetical protein n=1 Tax=Micromonospora haikouensis TaxID=686309 RepID=UPI0033EDDC71